MSPEELEDAQWREEADRVREEGRKRFAREIASRVDGLRGAVKEVKGDIMGKGCMGSDTGATRTDEVFCFRRPHTHICYHQSNTEGARSAAQFPSGP